MTLDGENLFSRDGVIIVRFGATPARVVCPSPTTCRATIPAAPRFAASTRRTVALTVTTGGGTSTPVTFTYDP